MCCFFLFEFWNEEGTLFDEEDIDMGSAAGSKGGLVPSASQITIMKKKRHRIKGLIAYNTDVASSPRKLTNDTKPKKS